MNASSRDAVFRVTSCTGTPCAATSSPIRSAPAATSRPPSAWSVTVMPAPASTSRSRRGSGVRTRTPESVCRSMNAVMLVSARSRPRPMTMRWSTVSAASLIRWLDTKTVRPCAAWSRMR